MTGNSIPFAERHGSTVAYIFMMAGQLAEMATKENLPALAHILNMAQAEAAEIGVS